MKVRIYRKPHQDGTLYYLTNKGSLYDFLNRDKFEFRTINLSKKVLKAIHRSDDKEKLVIYRTLFKEAK